MRKLLIIFVVFTVIVLMSLSVLAEEFDFRNVNWGMTKEEVKTNESATLYHTTEDLIIYEVDLNSYDFGLGYIFYDNKLIRAKYMLNETILDSKKYISIKDEFLILLNDIYGKPDKEDVIWFDDTYKGDYTDYGTAVSVGDLSYFYTWNEDKATITLGLYGDNYEVSFMIEYASVEYKDLEAKFQEKEDNKTKSAL